MASICNEGNGRKSIRFIGRDNKHYTVRLGAINRKRADDIRVQIESLIATQITGIADPYTTEWITEIDEELYDKLYRVKLVAARTSFSLGPFMDQYIADRTDAKPRTLINLKQARKDLGAFFGDTRPLSSISKGDAEEFWRHLLRRGLADNTARRTCGRAKQFFQVAIDKDYLTKNPFKGMKVHVQGNPDREFFVTAANAVKVLNACPTTEWKLLFSLARWGGVRVPSEIATLRWADVDWAGDKIRVRSPKTEHHERGASRLTPLFPEIRPHLLTQFEAAAEGEEFVVPRIRSGEINLRTQLERIIDKAGLDPWPKLWQNLRSTRQTELAETYPLHVVCAWLGNSIEIARKHYLQVTEDHFKKAGQNPGQLKAEEKKSGAPQTSKYGLPPKYRGSRTKPGDI